MTRREWERDAIRGLLDVLSISATVRLLGHPEDELTSPLSVDALVDRDGEIWAMEHMRLALDDRLPPAVEEIDQQLKEFVGELSDSLDLRIEVVVQPPVGDTKTRRRYFTDLRSTIEGAAIEREDVMWEDGTRVLVDAGATGSRVSTWMQDTPDLTQLVSRTSGPVLERKLVEQLSPATAEVDRVGLLLAQQHPPGTRQWPTGSSDTRAPSSPDFATCSPGIRESSMRSGSETRTGSTQD